VTGTEDMYVEIFSNILSEYDKIYTPEVRQKVLGTMEKDTCTILIKELDLPLSPEELMARQRQLQTDMLPKTQLLPGTINTFLHPHAHHALQGCQ
jgi:beta-phosphoglucomutase-like phosphatase (HAD superfamily)